MSFKLIKQEEIKEVRSQGYLYEHNETLARLIFLKNDDPNRVFAIGFRTTSDNSTGVAHIVEHCVLSGSRKYKTKEPFMDLLKGSQQTFLNAMTYPEKTLYPVASRNEKDLRNLMDVYLDAVFFPKMCEDELVFLQEGWRYETFDKDSPLEIQGVVYNEMKGAMSSPDSVAGEAELRALFPDTFYAYNSGGDPYEIPNLTYDAFREFHSEHYHPSNSYIYLYGDLDIEYYLKYIDEEYLSKFQRREVPKIEVAPNLLKPVEYKVPYNIPEGEDVFKKHYYSFVWAYGEVGSVRDYLTLSVLSEALIESDASPLRNRLLKDGLCEDVYSSSGSYGKNVIGFMMKNVKEGKGEEIKVIISDTLNKMAKEGLDKKLLEASLNKVEFNIKEGGGDFPTKGLIHYINMMNDWVYDFDPLDALKTNEDLKFLRDNLTTGYFEEYIKKHMLDNPHRAMVEIYPESGLSQKKDIEQREELRRIKENMSEKELNEIINKARTLKEMQETPDSPEALSTIPSLSIEDVAEDGGVVDYEIIEGKFPIIYRNAFTSGIYYFRISTDIKDLNIEELKYASLVSDFFGSLNTKNFTYQELSNEIYLSLGDLNFYLSCFDHEKTDDVLVRFNIVGKALRENREKIVPIFNEILFNTNWDSKERIFELLQMTKIRFEASIINSGNRYAMMRAKSYVSKSSKINECIAGISYYYFIKDLIDNYEERYQEIVKKLNEISKKILRKDGAMGMITCEGADFEPFKESLCQMVEGFSIDTIGQPLEVALSKDNEAFIINSQVQYVSKASYFPKYGIKQTGEDLFISFLLNLDYLHNNIRAMGGAYGAGMVMDGKGMACYSYRDPNLSRTIEVFDSIYEAIEKINLTKSELTTAIIGAMNQRNPQMTERIKGEVALSRVMAGITNEDVIERNREILSCDNEKIRERAMIYKRAMDENNLCVVGNKEKIESEKELFKKIIILNEA